MRSFTTVPFLVRGAIVALLFVIAAGLLLGPVGLTPEPQSAEATFLNEVKKLLASDAEAADNFGQSVAVSGDTAIVGATYEDLAGAAYIFQRDEGGANNWGEVIKLTASDAQAGDGLGFSVALSGDAVVVGAPWEDAGDSGAGAAYVFQRDEGGANNWGEVIKLTGSDAEARDLFGVRVSVGGDTAVVGAGGEDAGGDLAGAAYVFQRDEGGTNNWGEVAKLTASDAQARDTFGNSVAVSGDTAVVGAWQEAAGGSAAGAAYIFQRDEGGTNNWGEVTKLTASDAQAYDFFGTSVAVSGDTAVVGAYFEAAGGLLQAGAAYVFQRNQGSQDNWGEVKKLTASDADVGDYFGGSVAVSGGTAVAGAILEDAMGEFAGAAYVFQAEPPAPGDTDGDGCSDKHESGPDETLGGRRDYLDPNDYYDVYGPGQSLVRDGVIDLANDILGVIQHFAPLGTEPEYDVRFDRGPQIGANTWNMGPPDGVIDLANDILGVILQFNHSCA